MKSFNTFRLFSAVALAAALPVVCHAATEVALWHTLSGTLAQNFTFMVNQFNAEQKEVNVVLEGFADQAALKARLTAALQNKQAPMWVQWPGSDVDSLLKIKPNAFDVAQDVVKPVSKEAARLSEAAVAPYLNDNNKWMALPFTPAVPIIMYRDEALKKIGVNPRQPNIKTWRDLQAITSKLREAGYPCGIASIEPAWVHVENLASWQNEPYSVKSSKGQTYVFNGLLHVRHLALMVSWAKSDLMIAKRGEGALSKWASGECPMAIGPSTALSAVGNIESSQLGVAPMPSWEEVSMQQGTLLPLGDGLYLTDQPTPDARKAAQKFATWWLSPGVSAKWHQWSGSVPFSEAAYLATKQTNYYAQLGGWDALSARIAAPNSKIISSGYRANRDRVLALTDIELEKVFGNTKPPKAGLDDAVNAANALGGSTGGGAPAKAGKHAIPKK
ncbi:MAG: extracellular solute-binding protein [Burkholderiaceae bacterium]